MQCDIQQKIGYNFRFPYHAVSGRVFLAAISPYQTAGREQERGRVVCQRFIPPSLSYAFFATYFLLQSFTLLRTPILNPRYVRWTFSFPFHGHQTKG